MSQIQANPGRRCVVRRARRRGGIRRRLALQKFPGAKEAIMSYYAANAQEANCGAGTWRTSATPKW